METDKTTPFEVGKFYNVEVGVMSRRTIPCEEK